MLSFSFVYSQGSNPTDLISSERGCRESEVCVETRPDDRRLGGGRAQGHQDGHSVHEDDTATADVLLGHGNQGGIQRQCDKQKFQIGPISTRLNVFFKGHLF